MLGCLKVDIKILDYSMKTIESDECITNKILTDCDT